MIVVAHVVVIPLPYDSSLSYVVLHGVLPDLNAEFSWKKFKILEDFLVGSLIGATEQDALGNLASHDVWDEEFGRGGHSKVLACPVMESIGSVPRLLVEVNKVLIGREGRGSNDSLCLLHCGRGSGGDDNLWLLNFGRNNLRSNSDALGRSSSVSD